LRKAVEGVDQVSRERPVDIFAREFSANSVDFTVRWWAGSKPSDMHASRDAVIRAIKRALDDAGIEIPYPYVTNIFQEPMPIQHVPSGPDKGEESA
jgi:small-conductance mechanosensitive channel